MSVSRDDLVIPATLPSWEEHVRRNSAFTSALLERIRQLEEGGSVAVGVFLGGYDQVADVTTDPGGALQTADNFNAGDYYLLSANGVFSTPIPEINGETGGTGDMLFSDGTEWILFAISTNYLSSQVDDTAQGVITFAQPPKSTNAPVAGEDLATRSYVDSADSSSISNHNLAANAHNGTLAGLTRENTFTAASQRMVFAASGLRFQEVAGIGEVEGTNVAGALAPLNLSGTAVNVKASGGNVLWQGTFSGQTITIIGFDSFDMANGELREQGRRVVTEAPIDGSAYLRRDAGWDLYEAPAVAPTPSFAYLANGDISGPWNTTVKTITGYSESNSTLDMAAFLNPAAGYIEIPTTGVWEVMATVVGGQGNDIKEESMRLWLRLSNHPTLPDADVVVDVFDVATDKTSDRAFSVAYKRPMEGGERIAIGVNATASMGTFSFEITSLK